MQSQNSQSNPQKLISIRRIKKDLQELEKEPSEGIGIAQLNNNIFKYVVNTKILFGCYENLIIQMEMTIPENYPISPPEIKLFPNQHFHGFQVHHHVFLGSEGYCDLCIDITKNRFLSTNEQGSGWTAAYTLKSLLFQIQNFLAIHDLHSEPEPETVRKLFALNKAYTRKFVDEEGKEVLHSYENPFPKIHEKKSKMSADTEEDLEEQNKIKEAEVELFRKKLVEEEIKNHVTCYITKSNYFDDKEIALGYPVFINYDFKNRSEFIPIPEILSYDAFICQTQQSPDFSKLDDYFSVNFKSSMGQFFSHWFPIYLDENHFQKNLQTILNSFSILKWGPSGIKEYDFEPLLIFEIMPNFLNKMVIDIFSKGTVFSQTSIRCYFNFILLFRKLLKIYEKEHKDYVLDKLRAIKKNGDIINKTIVSDIGNFLMLIIFSDLKVKKEIIANVFEDIVSRTFYWILHVQNKKDENFAYFMNIIKNDYQIKQKYSNREIGNALSYSRLELWDELSSLSKNAIMEFYFKESKGNKLIILSILASKKFKDEEFLKRFEANYGVLLDEEVKEFLDLAKSKFTKIKNIYDLSGELDLEFVFESREKAFDKFLYLYYAAKNKCYLNLSVSEKFASKLNRDFYNKFYYGNFDYVNKTKMLNSDLIDKNNNINDNQNKDTLTSLLKNFNKIGDDGNKSISKPLGSGNDFSDFALKVDDMNMSLSRVSLNNRNKK